jgi:N-acetylmuramoyl-L-alanine amidase
MGKIMPRIRRMAVVVLFALAGSCVADAAPLIAVDVGHSRENPGAISARGVPEFEFNAALANVVRETLSSRGTRVMEIAGGGDMPFLSTRTAAARARGATFFLSIHHDSGQPQYLEPWEWEGVARNHIDRFSGFSLFVSRRNPQLAASLRCASRIGAALRQAGLQPTPHHAERIPGESKQWADRQNGVYYFDNLAVLKSAGMPAVLLEAGVILNRAEEQRLQTPEMRARIAAAIQRGLADCGMTGNNR